MNLNRVTATSTALALLAGCRGEIGDPGLDAAGVHALCEGQGVQVGPAPLRLLTGREYVRTVTDLLDYSGDALDGIDAQSSATGFDNTASQLSVTASLADEYMRAAETLAEQWVAGGGWPCDASAVGEDACARQLIDDFGRRAYRRPLDDEQIERLANLFAASRDAWGYTKGIELVVMAILQSPHFLYRVELGAGAPGHAVVPLDAWEVATRLSFFLWGSMPDDELFAAAEENRLATAEEVDAQARRMLDDPRARQTAAEFHSQWLGLGALDAMTKDTALYPEFDDAFKSSALEETRRFIDHVVFEGEGSLDTLLAGDYSFVDGPLAAVYGLATDAPDFSQVSLPAAQRAGILTHASFLSVTSKPNQTSPVARGQAVRERLMCQLLPEPPADVDTTPPEIDPSATTRERFEQHATDPLCASCHDLMDPIGFGFEHYDPVGRWRDDEGGKPIDATGVIVGGDDLHFDGAPELAALLAADEEVHRCFVRNWFTWAYGRAPETADACTLTELERSFADSERNVKGLMLAIVRSEAFRHRPAVEGP